MVTKKNPETLKETLWNINWSHNMSFDEICYSTLLNSKKIIIMLAGFELEYVLV